MTMLLLPSLIDGLCAFDLTSGTQAIAAGVVDMGLNLGLAKLIAIPEHSSAIAEATPHMPHMPQWLLAQQFETDVFAGARAWWSDFVSTGKIWTLIFGIVLGYLLRALTSYG